MARSLLHNRALRGPRPLGPGRRLAVMLAAGLAVAVAGPAAAEARPQTHLADGTVNRATLLAAKTYPGVQLIEVDLRTTLSLPEPTWDDSALTSLKVRLRRQILSGALAATNAAVVDAVVTEVAKSPFSYLKPTSRRTTQDAALSAFGTGWVVTPDGYMVTAAHVVKPDEAQIKQAFATNTLNEFTESFAKSLAGGSTHLTDDQVKKLTTSLTTWVQRYLTIGAVTYTYTAQIGVAVAGFNKAQKGHPVEVVAVGEPYPGKDVAVLKLDGVAHLPTLPLGKDDDVAAGDTLYVAGYPAASTFSSELSQDSQVQPTITQGPLTAVKSSASGTPVFQTQAPASGGNSGGPVLDDAGKVVGILAAAAVGDQGVALEGQEFVVPVSVVTEKLSQHNIKPATSDTTLSYDRAVDEFYQRHYKAALPLFQQAASLYPGHPYASDFISKSTAAIAAGKDETPQPVWVWVAVVAAVLTLVVLIAVVVLLIRRRGRRAHAGAPGGAPQGWPAQYLPPPAQQPYPPQQQYPAAGQAQVPGQGYPPGQGFPPAPGYAPSGGGQPPGASFERPS